MNIDMKRFKNYGLWVSVFSLIPIVLSSLGVNIIPEDYEKITTGILTIFATLGILNNPTTECKWYRDEAGNNIVKDTDTNQEVNLEKSISEKVIVEKDINEGLYNLIGELIKDKVSNMRNIENIENLLKQNLEGIYHQNQININNISNLNSLDNNDLNYKNILREDSYNLIKKNIEELLKENADSLAKDNLENLINEIIKNNISNLINEEAINLVRNALLAINVESHLKNNLNKEME